MAAPTVPTLSTLASEALSRAGYSNPSTALTTRATGQWMEEIKDDIWAKAKKLKSLQTKSIRWLTVGLGQYDNPSDFASELSLTFATGSRYGTSQSGTPTTLVLAASENALATDLIGKQIVFTNGTTSDMAYITGYDASTKTATIAPEPTVTAPTGSLTYMILDVYRELDGPRLLSRLGQLANPTSQAYPEAFYSEGDESNGQFILFPVPYRNDSQPLILIQRYYADLTELDLASALMSTLYQKWRNVWMTGLIARALDDGDDTAAPPAYTKYKQALQGMVSAEQYGNTLSVAQAQVEDYG